MYNEKDGIPGGMIERDDGSIVAGPGADLTDVVRQLRLEEGRHADTEVSASGGEPVPTAVTTDLPVGGNPSGEITVDDTLSGMVQNRLFGTLEIEGVGIFYVFVQQTRLRATWTLTDRDVFDDRNEVVASKTGRAPKSVEHIEAMLRINSSGRMEGFGKTYLLTRLLSQIGTMVGRAASTNNIEVGAFYMSGSYHDDPPNGDMIEFKALRGNNQRYISLQMSAEGFKLSVDRTSRAIPFAMPKKLLPVQDEKNKAAMVAGLGVRTFALLKRQRGSSLDWYNSKRYKLIQTDEEFRQMMLEFLTDVQVAHDNGQAVLAALDTETTGLNMFSLQPGNPMRDHIVAIPFGWRNDEAYVICTDMYYFNNVSDEEVYPLFDRLFRRNPDYTYQDIEINYCDRYFKFNRRSILLVGANAGFDERAFLCHGAEVFFDEDIQIMHYNLATDWVQGRNGLKDMTHRYLNTETLELEDLFGPQHKDKYRYLSDPQLALVYGGADADFPRTLWMKFKRLLPAKLYKLYKKYDMTGLFRTSRATWLGLPVDERGVKEQGEALLKDLDTLKNFIYRYAYAANRSNLEEKSEKLCNLLGLDSPTELIDTGERDGMYRYPFTPANHKNLLFNILGYPVLKTSEKSQEPALDKFVLEKLASRDREEPVEFLKVDIMSEADPTVALISKDKFNKKMYPLALVFQTYATLNKEYTAYYKPIMQNDLEGRMFYTFSWQRAATRRILSAGQTMKGSLKKLVIAPKGKLFMCFDASQIEYRHMASLAYQHTKALLQTEHPNDWQQRLDESGISRIFRMMQNEEADYHIETASMMTGKPQYEVTSKERKMYKKIGFGIPYGLGDQSMCESLFGKVTKENMVETKRVLDDYKKRQFEIIRLLESVRDSAFYPAKISDEFREMLEIGNTHVGIVHNFVGFYRLFILEKLTRARTGRIRRQAGNCAIQGGAAELFRRMLYNFHMGCVQAGINEKVEWLMLVHDEVDNIVDADIDVCKLIDVLQSSCTLRYEDHIPYYIGIGFGHNWSEAKDDSAELPVIMVDRLIAAYRAGKFSIPCDGNQPENLLKLKRHYFCDRIGEELEKLVGRIGPDFQWSDSAVQHVSDNFSNYIVRAYLDAFTTKEQHKQYGKEVPMGVMLEDWLEARKEYGFGKDFLSEKFVDATVELSGLQLDVPDAEVDTDLSGADLNLESLGIELLSDGDEDDMALEDQRKSQWYGEDSMFDYSIPSDEITGGDGEEGYRYFRDASGGEESTLEINENPTSAFDVFISKQYVRTNIFASGEDTFTVMLSGTPFQNKVVELGRAIRQEYGQGSVTLLLIGDDIRKVGNVDATPERLDQLDKDITGKG